MNNHFLDFDKYDIPEGGLAVVPERQSAENLVVIYQEDYNQHADLCHKIFGAVGINLEGYDGLVLMDKGVEINIAKHASAASKKVISFGIAPKKLGLNAKFTGYRIYQTDTFQLLLSHSLKQLSDNKERKKALWESLKLLYADKTN